MPGVASLEAQQYYAHPRNTFWPIVSRLLDFPADLDYSGKLQALNNRGYVLWDVVRCCERAGSLDSAIQPASVEINDFACLLAEYPGIERVFLNGGAAYKLWQKQVAPRLLTPITATQLPSTSPAYAAMSMAQKRVIWRQILI